MAKAGLVVTIRIAWWVRWYLLGVLLTSYITGLHYDEAKVEAWIKRGVRVVL